MGAADHFNLRELNHLFFFILDVNTISVVSPANYFCIFQFPSWELFVDPDKYPYFCRSLITLFFGGSSFPLPYFCTCLSPMNCYTQQRSSEHVLSHQHFSHISLTTDLVMRYEILETCIKAVQLHWFCRCCICPVWSEKALLGLLFTSIIHLGMIILLNFE